MCAYYHYYHHISPPASLRHTNVETPVTIVHHAGPTQSRASYDQVSLEASESLRSTATQPLDPEHSHGGAQTQQHQHQHQHHPPPRPSSPSPSPPPGRQSFDSLEEESQQQPPQPPPSTLQDGPPEPPPPQGRKNHGSSWWGTWYMELLSSGIAAGCLGAIVAILRTHQGRPLPEWRFEITINALVAVFTTIFKAALAVPVAEGISQAKWLWFRQYRALADMERFDRASRGVWGSVVLLFTSVPRPGIIWLANTGAILTIAALAVDPFSQQLIQSAPCTQNTTAGASIPKTQTYDRFASHLGPTEASLDGAMQVAIYLGLLSPPRNSSAALAAATTCPSGNCTFPRSSRSSSSSSSSDDDDGATFSTLGVCRSCADISATIARSNSSSASNASALPKSTLPSSGIAVQPTVMFASTTYGRFDPLLGFEALMSRNENGSDAFAVRCALAPCLKTYAANVTDAVYTETELRTVPLVYATTSAPSYSLATNTTLRDGTWADCRPSAHNSSTNTVLVNATTMTAVDLDYADDDAAALAATPLLWYPPDCVWQFQPQAVYSMSAFLASRFADKTLDSAYSTPAGAYGDTWLVHLYRNGTATMASVDAYMDGLVWSITAAMRENSADEGPLRAVKGQALVVKTCLVVRWAWQSLAAAVLGLEVAFLVAVMVVSRTSKHWGEDWKSSSLALLFHGLEGEVRGLEKGGQGTVVPRGGSEMMDVARGMEVQLRQRDAGWHFVQRD